jgi:hypothetical protein
LGFVDPERLGELLECEPAAALAQLDSAVFRDPMTLQWETVSRIAVSDALLVADFDGLPSSASRVL